MRKVDHVKEACIAHTNLNTFACVVAILESGCVYGHSPAAQRIIDICQAEQAKYLRAYDKHTAAEKGISDAQP